MNRQDFLGNVRNYNGKGIWSVEAVQMRYRGYCAAFHVETGRSIAPKEIRQGDVRWIYPIMDEVIQGIEENDVACIALGVDFVEEDALFPFGARLKSNNARALRRTSLTEAQKSRLRERISGMLASGVIPHEMREYAKLLRTIGVGEHWPRLEREIPRDNPYAMRFYKSLRAAAGLPV
jgi:hypothetical protein